MKHYIYIIAVLMLMAAWGCSSSNDGPDVPTTDIQPGSDTRPTWSSTDYSLYEQTMSVFLNLQPELVPYSSDQDLLCATVDGEVRGVASYDTDNIGFVLTVAGNSSGEIISLSYYCDRLHRIFTLANWATFDSNTAPMGTETLYKPVFPLNN
jgi:hypothetical protein